MVATQPTQLPSSDSPRFYISWYSRVCLLATPQQKVPIIWQLPIREAKGSPLQTCLQARQQWGEVLQLKWSGGTGGPWSCTIPFPPAPSRGQCSACLFSLGSGPQQGATWRTQGEVPCCSGIWATAPIPATALATASQRAGPYYLCTPLCVGQFAGLQQGKASPSASLPYCSLPNLPVVGSQGFLPCLQPGPCFSQSGMWLPTAKSHSHYSGWGGIGSCRVVILTRIVNTLAALNGLCSKGSSTPTLS